MKQNDYTHSLICILVDQFSISDSNSRPLCTWFILLCNIVPILVLVQKITRCRTTARQNLKSQQFVGNTPTAQQHGMAPMEYVDNEKFFVLRSFVDNDKTQRLIADEALNCHSRNEEVNGNINQGTLANFCSSSKSSLKLNLGISCGGDLRDILPNAVAVVRRAFDHASNIAKNNGTAKTLQTISNGPLSGLSLLYGLDAAMVPHYDSPTQPGQRDEWLCMMSFGNTMIFRCDNDTITIQSGDVIVMDAMSTLHGVERIVPDDNMPLICSRIGFPIPQVRLGILLWQGRVMPAYRDVLGPVDDVDLEGSIGIFDNDDYD